MELAWLVDLAPSLGAVVVIYLLASKITDGLIDGLEKLRAQLEEISKRLAETQLQQIELTARIEQKLENHETRLHAVEHKEAPRR